MHPGERREEPTARARSGHAACEAAFFMRGWSRHASRPALPRPPCGRWFRAQRAEGGGLRVERARLVCGGGARPGGFRSSHIGSAHCADKAVASLRICSPASRAPVASSLRGSRGCPEQIRTETPLYPTPPAHPSVAQQSRPLRHHSRRAVAALPSQPGSARRAFSGRNGHASCVSLGAPPAPAASGLGGAAEVRRAHDASRGIDRGFRALVPRRRQATGRAKRRCAPRFAGFPFGTSGGVGPPVGWPSARVDRSRLVGVASLLPFLRKEA